MSIDPAAASVGNFNRYWYANNNPYRFTDPDGRVSWDGFVEGVKNVVAPSGQELARRGEPGTAGSNAVGAAKQVGNTVIGLAEAAVPIFRLTGLPRMEIANNQLEGAAAAEFVTSVALVAAPLAKGATAGAKGAEVSATAPVGRLGSPMDVPRGTNSPAVINGRQYTGHALDQMQGRGLVPSVVEDTISRGATSAGHDGATVYTTEQARAVLNPNGSVKTAYPYSGQ